MQLEILNQLFSQISELLENSRKKVGVAVNQTVVLTYFEIGSMIVEDDKSRENREEYGKTLLKNLSILLTAKFGRGFSDTDLRQMRNFYILYSEQIQQTPSVKFNLNWSHYLKLMRLKDINGRKFYEIESFKNNWSLREIQLQCDSALFARLSLSKNREKILQFSEKGQFFEKLRSAIKKIFKSKPIIIYQL